MRSSAPTCGRALGNDPTPSTNDKIGRHHIVMAAGAFVFGCGHVEADPRRTDYSAPVDILDFAAVTHPGTLKSINEDSVLAKSPVFVVADGISGCHRGDRASGLLTDIFSRLADQPGLRPEDVAETLELAQREVLASQQREQHTAASTASGAVAVRAGELAYWVIFNIGDSRVYRLSGDDLEQITVDHSHVQDLLDAGVITPDQAAHHPERNVITRAVGSIDGFQPDYWMVPMIAGDRLLLCSDGLLRETDPEQVFRIVSGPNDPRTAVGDLLALALAAGARDNVSIIVVDVRSTLDSAGHAQQTVVFDRPSW